MLVRVWMTVEKKNKNSVIEMKNKCTEQNIIKNKILMIRLFVH
jgi:hypothetical protein